MSRVDKLYEEHYGVPTGNVPRVMPPGAIGDINSDAKGSGARYNAGKPKLSLIPLTLIAKSYGADPGSNGPVSSLHLLGRFQETGEARFLYSALEVLDREQGWAECAAAFEYGLGKYAPWNWAKGMQWSVPLECAARHLLAIIEKKHEGDLDPESKVHHRGHVYCNVVMLLTFLETYPEGNDLPKVLAR